MKMECFIEYDQLIIALLGKLCHLAIDVRRSACFPDPDLNIRHLRSQQQAFQLRRMRYVVRMQKYADARELRCDAREQLEILRADVCCRVGEAGDISTGSRNRRRVSI